MISMILGAAVGGGRDVRHRLHLLRPAACRTSSPKASTTSPPPAVQQALAANLPRDRHLCRAGPRTLRRADGRCSARARSRPIHYNTAGFAGDGPGDARHGPRCSTSRPRLVIGLALLGIGGRVTDFGSRARVAVLIALAGVAFCHLSVPIYYHSGWPYFIYVFVADVADARRGGADPRLVPAPADAWRWSRPRRRRSV